MMKNEYDDNEYDEVRLILIVYHWFEFVYELYRLKDEMMVHWETCFLI